MGDGHAKQNTRVGSREDGLHRLDDLRQWSIDNKEAMDDLSNKEEFRKQRTEGNVDDAKAMAQQNINFSTKQVNPLPRKP